MSERDSLATTPASPALYLPLVMRNYATLCNGDFEKGDWACWAHGGELNRAVTTLMPHSGKYSALLGDPQYDCWNGVPVASAWMSQIFTVPLGKSATLSFWYRIYSQDLLSSDSLDVYINGNRVLHEGNSTADYGCNKPLYDSGWKYFSYDLSMYQAQTIELRFENSNRTDGWFNTWTFVDDVQVHTLTPPTPTSTSTPTPTRTSAPTPSPTSTATPTLTATPSWCRSFNSPLSNSGHPGEFEIDTPGRCADGLPHTNLQFGGTYTGISDEHARNLEVWGLVKPEDHRYYVQSSDACSESPAEFGGGLWSVKGNLGREGVTEVFDIVVVVTNKGSNASTRFKQYLREGCDTGTYEGIPHCDMPTDLTEKARITVRAGTATPTMTPTPGPTPSWCRSFRPPLSNSGHPGEFEIVRPGNCTDNLPHTNLQIAGTYSGISDEDERSLEVWVLAYPENHRYYPQSSEACSECPADFGGSVWSVTGNLGREGVTEVFDIVVVVTNIGSQASTKFKQYLRTGCDTGIYEGILPSQMPTDLTEKASITVRVSGGTSTTTPMPTATSTGAVTPTSTPTATPTTCSSPREPIEGMALPGEVEITNPANCATGIPAGVAVPVAGTYSGVPDDMDIWVLVYPHGHPMYYPQSDDACQGLPTSRAGGRWTVTAYIGRTGFREWFDIVAVVANSEASAFFSSKLIEWCNQGDYPGLLPSELPLGIMEKDSVTIQTAGGNAAAAYAYLYEVMDRYQSGSMLRLLESYDDIGTFSDGDTAWTYDNALAMLALMARGTEEDWVRARVLADSLIYAQTHDPAFDDGRLRDAYHAAMLVTPDGKVSVASPGSGTGNTAWAVIALLRYWEFIQEHPYLAGAMRLGQWIYDNTFDARGFGGYTGGFENVGSNQKKHKWKATEHNIDVYVAFLKLYEATGDSQWLRRAMHAKHFVRAMWDEEGGHFWTGTLNDGVSVNFIPVPEDAQSWGLMALGEVSQYGPGVTWVENNLLVHPCMGCEANKGFRFSDRGAGCWWEGTAHMVIAFQIKGEGDKADAFFEMLRQVQTVVPNNNGKGIVSACPGGADSGYGGLYPNALHIGATAWYLFAERRHNPFWGIGTGELIPYDGLYDDFLETLARDTWDYLSSDWATDNHLPWSWRSSRMSDGHYANPAEIGLYILSHIGAYEMRESWSPPWEEVEAEVEATLDQLEAWQSGTQSYQPHGPNSYNNSVFYQAYWINWNPPVVGDGDYNHQVPSIDNAWLAVSLITIREYAEANSRMELAKKANDVLKEMDFTIWYHPKQHMFSWGAPNDPQGGGLIDHYSNENRIINFVARALGQLSEDEFKKSLRALAQKPGTYDRGTPDPSDDITVGKVNWDGSYFTYVAPALFIEEMQTRYGKYTINRATEAQIAYAEDQGYPVWGISDCFDVEDGPYVQRGAPPRGSGNPLGDEDDGLITPHTSAMALITAYASDAIVNLRALMDNYPDLYDTNYGFKDSVNVITNKVSYRFGTLDQEWIFLSLMNYLNATVWNYFYKDEGVQRTHIEMYAPSEFQKGMNYATWWQGEYRSPESDQSLQNLAATGTKWLSLVVTGYQETLTSTIITYTLPRTPTDADLTHVINKAHSLGMKVMLKPHVDVSSGEWRGEIDFGDDEVAWQAWFASYRDFINHYAALAKEKGVEQFCVGTEFVGTSEREADWREVIAGVRNIFSGTLIYASNHSGEETSINWWDAMDYIGVDAYYPLTDKNAPTLEELTAAWVTYVATLEDLTTRYNRPIILTEIGYRSVDGANKAPWDWWTPGTIDLQEQADCYRAALEAFWGKPWFAGIYWWYWSTDPDQGGPNDGGYSPHNKPSEAILKSYYQLRLYLPTVHRGTD